MPDSASARARGGEAMTEARVPRLPMEEAKAAADEARIPDYMAELSIFQVLLNHPTLARAVNDLLATMLWHGRLAPRLRELVIMRIGWLMIASMLHSLEVPLEDSVSSWPPE